jgi:deoxyribonuclease-4
MFGSHLSIAGGMENALLDAERLELQTVQVFTKNQQQWVAKPLTAEAIVAFRTHARRIGFADIVAHDSYLINLAAADPVLRAKSIAAFSDEIGRCAALGIRYLVTHPGAHVGAGEAAGLQRIIDAFDEISAAQPPGDVIICIESTAGQGTGLGYRLEHLAEILGKLRHPEHFGVCLDTCHLLAAGYDLTSAQGTEATIEEFDRRLGLKHLRVWHLNDSKKPLGSRVDRHEHIGRGCIGLAAFGVICRDGRFARVPKILETAKEIAPNGRAWDEINLEILRALAAGKTVTLQPIAEPRASKAVAKPTRAAGKRKKPATSPPPPCGKPTRASAPPKKANVRSKRLTRTRTTGANKSK